MNAALEHLNRYSTPAKALAEPAPDDAQLKQILQVAMSAPDHGRLYPYRFITIRGDARYRLSEIFVQATRQREPEVDAAYLAKQREKPLRSPLIVVVVATLIESEKIPKIEQMLSAGAAAHNILHASSASFTSARPSSISRRARCPRSTNTSATGNNHLWKSSPRKRGSCTG
jgi:nitroreductase